MLACDIYFRGGKIYLPTMAKVPGGGHQGIDPVLVAPLSDHQVLRDALRETLTRGNPLLNTSVYADIPKSSLLTLAGVKSFSAFARGTSLWSIVEEGGQFKIEYWKKGPVCGWVPDPEKTVVFPLGSSPDDVIERMIEILHEKR
jgi:hypothetical protein